MKFEHHLWSTTKNPSLDGHDGRQLSTKMKPINDSINPNYLKWEQHTTTDRW